MSNSKIVIEFRLPTTSYIRISDAIQALNDVVKEHRGTNWFTTVLGPYTEESENASISSSSRSPELGRSTGAGAVGPAPSAPSGTDSTEPVKRRPGRPRKTEARPSSESEQSSLTGQYTEGSTNIGAESPIEHVSGGPGQSPVQSSGEGQGRDGSNGGSRFDQRGASAPDRLTISGDLSDPRTQKVLADDSWDDEPESTGEDVFDDEWADSPVEPQDFDEAWHAKAPGDEWPASLMPEGLSPQTIDRTALNTLLGDHFRACGDKTRETTLAVIEKATGTGWRSLGQVPPGDYWKLARYIVKDIKRYEHGLLKPKS